MEGIIALSQPGHPVYDNDGGVIDRMTKLNRHGRALDDLLYDLLCLLGFLQCG